MVILIKIMYIILVGIVEKIRLGTVVKLVSKALNFKGSYHISIELSGIMV